MSVRRTETLPNRDGLHARSCTAIVTLARKYSSSLTIGCGDKSGDGRSIFDLMLLGAGKGAVLEIHADGPDAEALAGAVAALVASGFGED
jgi:phosphotransferase system HPr (HPr) family protein